MDKTFWKNIIPKWEKIRIPGILSLLAPPKANKVFKKFLMLIQTIPTPQLPTFYTTSLSYIINPLMCIKPNECSKMVNVPLICKVLVLQPKICPFTSFFVFSYICMPEEDWWLYILYFPELRFTCHSRKCTDFLWEAAPNRRALLYQLVSRLGWKRKRERERVEEKYSAEGKEFRQFKYVKQFCFLPEISFLGKEGLLFEDRENNYELHNIFENVAE